MFDILIPDLFLMAGIGATAIGVYFYAGHRSKQEQRTEIHDDWRNTGSFRGW